MHARRQIEAKEKFDDSLMPRQLQKMRTRSEIDW